MSGLGWMASVFMALIVALLIDMKYELGDRAIHYFARRRQQRRTDFLQEIMEQEGAMSYRHPIAHKHNDAECDEAITMGGDDVPPTAA